MSITYHRDILQNSEEWFDLRLGKITASVVKQLLTPTFKIAKNDKVRALAYELAAQRITGRQTDNFQNWDMERGHIEEDIARAYYSKNTGNKVEEVAFIETDKLSFILGYSPDGLVGDDGLIEIKSRQQKFQVKTFAEQATPDEYKCQLQTALLVTERDWIDFVQFSNGMPLYIERHTKDKDLQAKIIEACVDFEESITKIVETYKENSSGLESCEWVEHTRDDEIIGG